MSKRRIVIVGGGIAGLSTAWFLSRSNDVDVVLVERERALGRHATAQNAAILRTAIDDPALARLAARGARFLAHPPVGFERALLDPCGMLLVTGEGSGEPTCGSGRTPERVTRSRLRELAPMLRPDRGAAWWLAGEGRVNVHALVTGFERGARGAGVRFVLGNAVSRIVPAGRGVVLADGTQIDADDTIIAAGAWAAPLARAIGSRVVLSPTRRPLIVSCQDERIDPRGPIVWSDVDGLYARPADGGLMMCPCDEDAIEPDALAVSTEALALNREKCSAAFESFEPRAPARFWAGLRTHAADRRFVIGRDADVAGLVWAAGLGGHGITCCAAVGEIAAAAVLERELPRELVEPFSPARFSPAGAHRNRIASGDRSAQA